ncbi:MAG: PhoH family protein [Mariprofundaceae bacterium]|nr:PhoH family protein [Mariprofundaceae bacterium]
METIDLSSMGPSMLAALCGPDSRTIKQIEKYFHVRFLGKPGQWSIEGEHASRAGDAVRRIARQLESGSLTRIDVAAILADDQLPEDERSRGTESVLIAGRRRIQGKTANQRQYLRDIHDNTLTLSIGPAGSGKTYLAVAAAVVALNSHEVERIILTRPAVEAGERLGFLPGDLQQKVDPYLRPLFDALTDMVGVEKMNALMEQGRIEIAPLAYMRGRTLNDAFIILDEAQNTTRAQMKMFLTRLGFGSKMVVTGDSTQVDLPQHHHSGLLHALQVLEGVEDVGICRLTGKDVVRHRLVEKIVAAYEKREDG